MPQSGARRIGSRTYLQSAAVACGRMPAGRRRASIMGCRNWRCHSPVRAYDASFTVAAATTTPFRVPVSPNDALGPSGCSTTAAICPSLA